MRIDLVPMYRLLGLVPLLILLWFDSSAVVTGVTVPTVGTTAVITTAGTAVPAHIGTLLAIQLPVFTKRTIFVSHNFLPVFVFVVDGYGCV